MSKPNGAAAGGVVSDAFAGRGLSLVGFVQALIATACFVVVTRNHPEFEVLFAGVASPAGKALLVGILFWIAPLQDFGYVLDRIGAVRAQTFNMLPYALDLLPTLPAMLPHVSKVINNIEQIGPFIPYTMAPGVKEHMLPLMAEMMEDIEDVLPYADVLKPVLPKVAPHMREILPYTKQLLPYTEQLLPILEVEGWYEANKYMDKIAPVVHRIAPHAKVLAVHLDKMLPYLPLLVKHMDSLIGQIDETMEVLDKLAPLMPLLPAADQAGLLSQPLAFKALPTLVGLVPLSNDTTGRAAQQAAIVHLKLVAKAQEVQASLIKRYQLYQQGGAKALEDEPTLALEDAVEVEEEKVTM